MEVNYRDQLPAGAITAHDAQKDFSDELWDGVLDQVASHLPPSATVLDVGVGTGLVASRIADRGARVIGLDFNTSMLSELHRRSPRLACAVADARELPVRSDSMNAVVVTNVLHLLEDWERLVAEATRVLDAHGVVFVSLGGGGRSEVAGAINQYFRRLVSTDTTRTFGPESESHLAEVLVAHGFRSLPAIVGSEIRSRTIRSMIDRLELNIFTWPPGTSYDQLAAAARRTRAWADTTFGSQDRHVDVEVELRLSVFARR